MISFTHPFYLWLLCLGLLPVVLHLLNLRKLRVVVFPSVRFLKVSRQPQEGRRRLRDLLLLVLRLLSILAVVLVLSGMRWQKSATGTPELSRRTAVLVLDASASMGSQGRWLQATQQIKAYLAAHAQDSIGMAIPDGRELTLVPPTTEHWRLQEAMAGAAPSNYRGEPAGGLLKAVAWLQRAGGGDLEIYSDFQVTEWQRPWGMVPQNVSVRLHDTRGEGKGGNCGITGVSCSRLNSQRLRVIVTMESSSSRPEQRTLLLQAGGKSTTESIQLQPFEQRSNVYVLDRVTPGQGGVAQLSADEYTKDDSWVFWDDGDPPRQLLLVTGGTEIADSAAEAAFVQRAFASQPPGAHQVFVTSSADISLLTGDELAGSHGVFILGCMEFLQDDALVKLKRLVEQGGVLWVTPSRNPGADLARLRDMGMDLASVQGMVDGEGGSIPEGVGGILPHSPLAALFRQADTCDLFMFPIRRLCRLAPRGSSKVVVSSLSGKPLLLEQSVGLGKCFLPALGFSRWWSDFPLTNSFLPLLHEMTLQGLSQVSMRRQATCGSRVPLTDGSMADTVEPGVHRDERGHVEVNVDRSESNPHHVGKLDMLDLLYGAHGRPAQTSASDGDLVDLSSALGWLLLTVVLLEILGTALSDWRRTSVVKS